jgi:hypothetical protein
MARGLLFNTYAIIPLLYLASSLLHRAKIVQPSFCSSAKTWPVTFTAKTSRASVIRMFGTSKHPERAGGQL